MERLNDPNARAQIDTKDALGFTMAQPGQLTHDFGLAHTAHFGEIDNVVFAGMGGSSLVAEFARTWPGLDVPFVISKEYRLPSFISARTLVIAASYSGNTEETLEALNKAEEKGAQIAIIAHGGKLLEIAQQKGYVVAVLPESPQPRTGVFYAYRALVEILMAAKLIEAGGVDQLSNVSDRLTEAVKAWAPDIADDQNEAKQLALAMVGKTPIVYGGPLTYPAAYKWKIDVNENAKNTAWCSQLPEFNHNEFIGWSSHPIEKPFAVIDLLSSFEHPRVLKRFEVTDRLLSGKRPKSISVQAKGETVLEQLLYLVLLGDMATTYLALLNGVDPTPVELVERFKKELD